MDLSRDLVIGVDGGGTKTVAWLAPAYDPSNTIVLGRGRAGPGNPRAAGFDIAQRNIAAAVEAAFVDAKLQPIQVAAACFGLAGAGRTAEQEVLVRWALERGIATRVKVTGDAEPVLAAVTADNVGIVLLCGTGSFAWGKNGAGEIARCGGWGYLLGDEGSGYAIARAALTAAVRAADGRDPPTALLDALSEAISAESPQAIVERVYAAEMTRERLAGLAAIVCELAATDATARTIIDDAAAGLAEMVVALARRLDLQDGEYPLALAGSVILNQPPLEAAVCNRLAPAGLAPASTHRVEEPVRGAVALARQLLS
jgi:N-acetylglucosamine kinase-like BadF-type ATPase